MPGNSDFAGAEGYLNTASIGIPPRAAVDELQAAVERWGRGEAEPREYDVYVDRSRELWGRLHGADASAVAVGPQLSYFSGMVAAALPEGAEVVAYADDFTSVLFPFLERCSVRFVEELGALPDAIRSSTALVAVSAVQSATGEVADLAALREAAADRDALTFVDATQASGWLPIDAGDADFLAAAGYKWLLAPRGTAFMAVRDGALERLRPTAPGWFAGEPRWEALYGGPLRLPREARRLDLSPAWLSWVGTARALEYLLDVGVEAIHAHDVALADRVRTALGLEPGGTAMLSLPGAEPEELERRGLRVAERAGRVRASFHLYNTEADADALIAALTP
jgi:selenocysteine lyase/cysteine desulfurase